MTTPLSTVLLGGARSGKSDLAVKMAQAWGGPVTLIATAEAFDADMTARIARHRLDRPTDWTVVEEPIDLGYALHNAADDHLVLVDCLTVWVGTLMFREYSEDDIQARVATMLTVVARRTAPTIFVSNEVGLGVHPETDMGREYRDILGRVNQRVVAGTDRAFFLVAGRALLLLDGVDLC
jgi:adenosylcobinamide kinase / adenosylcobinamide-phosphate guanylyltransferase